MPAGQISRTAAALHPTSGRNPQNCSVPPLNTPSRLHRSASDSLGRAPSRALLTRLAAPPARAMQQPSDETSVILGQQPTRVRTVAPPPQPSRQLTRTSAARLSCLPLPAPATAARASAPRHELRPARPRSSERSEAAFCLLLLAGLVATQGRQTVVSRAGFERSMWRFRGSRKEEGIDGESSVELVEAAS